MDEGYLEMRFRRLEEGKLKVDPEPRVINPFDDNYTSELVLLSQNPEDAYSGEFRRRLHLLELSPNQIQETYFEEKKVLEKNSDEDLKSFRESTQKIVPHLGEGKRLFNKNEKPGIKPCERLASPKDLTLSELLLLEWNAEDKIYHETEEIYALAGEERAEEILGTFYFAASKEFGGQGFYETEFNERTEKLGWSEDQRKAFKSNERRLLERLGYRRNKSINAWVKTTVDLRKKKE